MLAYGLKRLPITVFSICTIPLTPARAVRLYELEQGEPLGSPLLGLY
jgi:hypothetical protein